MSYYYLHTNGDLIYKPNYDVQDLDNSDFVEKYWEVDLSKRECGWIIIIESVALGGNKQRILQLAERWKINMEDMVHFLTRHTPTPLQKAGIHTFVCWLGYDFDKYLDELVATNGNPNIEKCKLEVANGKRSHYPNY